MLHQLKALEREDRTLRQKALAIMPVSDIHVAAPSCDGWCKDLFIAPSGYQAVCTSWVPVPPKAAFFFEKYCLGRVVLCCFVFLSKHLMDN